MFTFRNIASQVDIYHRLVFGHLHTAFGVRGHSRDKDLLFWQSVKIAMWLEHNKRP